MDTTNWLPWSDFPALTAARLEVVAAIICAVRREAVRTHEPSKGDDSWVLGCRAFRRTCSAIAEATDEHSWLTLIESKEKAEAREKDPDSVDPDMHFVFAIGSVPLRFYRGSPDKASRNSLKRKAPELRVQQLVLDFDVPVRPSFFLRLAIETDEAGLVERVVLVEVEDGTGQVGRRYAIPLEAQATVRQFRRPDREGRDLGEPDVFPKRQQEKDKDEPA